MDADTPSLDLSAFDRRLNPQSAAPLAVAFSGGGDSLAALVAAKLWADRVGRQVTALHVDHGLQAVSGHWARMAAMTAARLGAGFEDLPWTGDKPATGVSAAARAARHALIANAARAAGARVVVFGHTADDILEAELMRAEGSNLGRLSEWRPSPAWPEGRGVFLLRPLLAMRRVEIRARLAPMGLNWIEDPANSDPRSLRARARQRLAADPGLAAAALVEADTDDLADLARAARVDVAGAIRIERTRLIAASRDAARRFLSAALVCASGGTRPPRRDNLEALIARLASAEAVVATLAGARLSAEHEILIVRESGSYRRHGAPVMRLEPGASAVWDGRFLLHSARSDPVEIRALKGVMSKLDEKQKIAISAIEPEARPALPAAPDTHGGVTCPILAVDGAVTAISLVADRLKGVCGVIMREPVS